MINERAMTQGSWEVNLRRDAPYSFWDELEPFGHLVITPQELNANPAYVFADDGVLGAARYSGVLLRKEINGENFSLGGAGMVWWLGDESGNGPILETKVSLSSSTLDNALTQVLPDAITKGTITETGSSYTGTHHFETSLEAVRTICASMGAEYRVNPDGTIDAGPKNSVYTIDTPEVVIVRKGSGADPLYIGVEVQETRAEIDSRDYASRIAVTTQDSNNVMSLVDAVNRTPAPTQVDMHGNLVSRTAVMSGSGAPVAVGTYMTTMLVERAHIQTLDISTQFYEIYGGSMRVGDAFYCFDPPAFKDDANVIYFRGQAIHPAELRMLAASWPLVPGMGVYYRTPTDPADYIDLTPYVRWEHENTRTLVR